MPRGRYVPRQQGCAVRKQYESGYLNAQVERINGSTGRPLVYLFAAPRPMAKANSIAL